MEDVVREEVGHLRIDIVDEVVGAFVRDVELTRIRLNGSVVDPSVVIPPGFCAGNSLLSTWSQPEAE
jgi:hypothetical protein